MATVKKAGAVTFTHNPGFTGQVEIRRGDVAIKVSMDALRNLVAESVRDEAIRKLETMTPAELLAVFKA